MLSWQYLILRLYRLPLSHLSCKCLLEAACRSPTSMIPRSHPRTVIWTPSTFSGFLSTVRSTVFAQRRARQKLAGDGPGGHVLVGKREKNLVMVGGPPEAPECVLHQTEKKSVGYGGGVGHVLETPSGDEEKARWGRCWRKVGGCRCWRADEHFFRWSRQAACNGDSRAPRLSLELKRVILTTLPHSHSLMLSLFSYHRKTWHQFVKTLILLIFFIFCAI